MYTDNFSRVFSRRAVICFFIMVILFFSCVLRVAVTATANYAMVQKNQSSLRLSAADLRGTIYDCNMNPITNKSTKIIAAVSPVPRAITGISSVLSGEELENVLGKLKSGKPALCTVPQKIECDGIVCTEIYEHNSHGTPAIHIVGYTDSDSHGVSGIEKAYDKLLYSDKKAGFVYATSGNGGILEGVTAEIENDTSVIAKGVISTIDANIQSVAEKAAEKLGCGAVIVADSKTSKIRATASLPNFDCTDIESYLKADNSPLLNRALSAYSVGSVFKPCVAAAGVESGYGSFVYNCLGRCKIIDRYFKCHNLSGHGEMNLKTGLANSCNTFFYNYAFKIGGERIYQTASSLCFGQSIGICDGISTAEGSLPNINTLSNVAYLANFSIGQGELLLSPVSMLTLYSSIAFDGTYSLPSVVEGTVKDGTVKKYNTKGRTRVMSKKTAETLRGYLTAVIEEGTGKKAKPDTVSAAGKTATAQTGKFEGGREVCQGWFCGFFPAENPKYTVIVFSENTDKSQISCGEVFADIADKITDMERQ